MISTVASPSTDAAGVATPGTGDSGDSGVFDVLLTLQSQASADIATALEGADLLAGMLEDSAEEPADNSTGDAAEGALWFLASLVPATKVSAPPVAAGNSVAAHFDNDAPHAGVAPLAAAQGTPIDLAQAFGSGTSNTETGDPQSPAPNSQAAVTVGLDTTTWNSLTGPAELFAQVTRGTAERTESGFLATHVRDPRWADDLGNRLASMVRTGESSASLQLSPPDMGPLEVNVSVRENQATVHFGAANAETRALLEASMPRLREMLAAQGFALMDSSVSHGFARQTRHESAGTPRIDVMGEAAMPIGQAIHITGLLDLYA